MDEGLEGLQSPRMYLVHRSKLQCSLVCLSIVVVGMYLCGAARIVHGMAC